MSQKQPKQPRKKQRSHSSGKITRRLLTIILTFVISLVVLLVIYAIRNHNGAPSIGNGIVRPPVTQATESTEPGTTEPITESTTEATDPTEDVAEESTEEPTEESTEPAPELQQAQALLDEMTLEEKIYQLFVVTPATLTGFSVVDSAGATTQEALEAYPVGGLIYLSENIYTESQITNMISNSQDYSGIPLLICADEEDGSASYLNDIGITDGYDPMSVYSTEGDMDRVFEIGQNLSEQLGSFGFNLNFAPVADIAANPNSSYPSDDDPESVAEIITAMVRGLHEGGSISCLQHFPGYGSADADSAEGASVTERTLDELRETEIIPLQAGIEAGAQMIMLSHVSAPNVTGGDVPCDLSPAIATELLREELGFTGVIITDSHEMDAILDNYESGEAALLAIQAGCDIILMPDDMNKAFEAILAAVENGELTEERINESVLRILALKYRNGLIASEE